MGNILPEIAGTAETGTAALSSRLQRYFRKDNDPRPLSFTRECPCSARPHFSASQSSQCAIAGPGPHFGLGWQRTVAGAIVRPNYLSLD